MDENILNQAALRYDTTPGVSSVRLKDGTLIFNHVDVVFGFGTKAMMVSHVYNSSETGRAGIDYKCGKCWKLDHQQYVYKNNNDYMYIDSLGKTHTFKLLTNNTYGEEKGTGLVLTVEGNLLTIKDLQENKIVFLKRSDANIYDIYSSIPYNGTTITYIHDAQHNLTSMSNGQYTINFKYRLNSRLEYLEVREVNILMEKINYYYDYQGSLERIDRRVYKNNTNYSKILTKFSYIKKLLRAAIDIYTGEAITFEYNSNDQIKGIETGTGYVTEVNKTYYLNFFGDNIYLGDNVVLGENVVKKEPSIIVDSKHQLTELTYDTNNNFTTVTIDGRSYEYHYDVDGRCTSVLENTEAGVKTLNQPVGLKLNVPPTNAVKYFNNDYLYEGSVGTNQILTIPLTLDNNVESEKLTYGTEITNKINKQNYVASFYVKANKNQGITKAHCSLVVSGTTITGSNNIYSLSKGAWTQVVIPLTFTKEQEGSTPTSCELKLEGVSSTAVEVSTVRVIPSSLTKLYTNNNVEIKDLTLTEVDPNKLTFLDMTYNMVNKALSEEEQYLVYHENLQKQYYGTIGIDLYQTTNQVQYNSLWYEKKVSDDGQVTTTRKVTFYKTLSYEHISENNVLMFETTTTRVKAGGGTTTSVSKVYTDIRGEVLLTEDEYGVQRLYTTEIDFKSSLLKAKGTTTDGTNHNLLVTNQMRTTNQHEDFSGYKGKVITNDGQIISCQEYELYSGALISYKSKGVNSDPNQLSSYINYNNYTYDNFEEQVTSVSLHGNTPITIERNIVHNLIPTNEINNLIITEGGREYKYEYDEGNELTKVLNENDTTLANYQHDKITNEIEVTNHGVLTKETYDEHNRTTKLEQNGYTADYTYYSSRGSEETGLLKKVEIKKNNVIDQTYEYEYNENNLLKNYTIKTKNAKMNTNEPNKYNGVHYTKLGSGYLITGVNNQSSLSFDINSDTQGFKYERNYIMDEGINKRLDSSYTEYTPDDGVETPDYHTTVDTANRYDEIGRVYKKIYEKSRVTGESNNVNTIAKKREYLDNSVLPIQDKICYNYVDYDDNDTNVYTTTYNYGYDNGRVANIDDGVNGRRYTYNLNNQIQKEEVYTTSGVDVQQYKIYSYDNRGNISSIRSTDYFGNTYDFEYSGDQLTGVKNSNNTYKYSNFGYNSNGYMTSYIKDGKIHSLTWSNGKLIKFTQYSSTSTSTINKEIEYTYDVEGRRTSKKVRLLIDGELSNDRLVEYQYNGNELLWEKSKFYNGSTLTKTISILYTYDETGVTGFIVDDTSKTTGNNEAYLYVKDILGNVVEIVKDGDVLVKYDYDAYGNFFVNYNTELTSIPDNVDVINPILYRGYYYDEETGMFWLSSRYYSPELCRFISPDDVEYLDPESINGLNLYCYCLNNPISYVDPSGHFAISAIIIGAIFGFAGTMLTDYLDDKKLFNGSQDFWDYFGGTIAGAIGGVAGAFGLNMLGSVAFSAVGDTIGGLISGDINSWETFGQTLALSVGASIFSVGISSFVGDAIGTRQYKALRGISTKNIKVNNYIKGLKGSFKRAGVTALKIGKNSMDDFLRAFRKTTVNVIGTEITGNLISTSLGIWF